MSSWAWILKGWPYKNGGSHESDERLDVPLDAGQSKWGVSSPDGREIAGGNQRDA
jgi:hypothetical protein